MADNYTDIGGDIQKWFSNKVSVKIDDMKKFNLNEKNTLICIKEILVNEAK